MSSTSTAERPTSMDTVPFTKMSGSGNDFILIDHRTPLLDENRLTAFISGVCRRRLSVGADGVILIERAAAADFRWRFFNSDGSTAAMCGNGARCAARFAHLQGICGPDMRFETGAGVVEARVEGRRVRVKGSCRTRSSGSWWAGRRSSSRIGSPRPWKLTASSSSAAPSNPSSL